MMSRTPVKTLRRAILLVALATSCTARPVSPPANGAQTVAPQAGLANLEKVAWDRAEISRDGRSLTVFFTGGERPCGILGRVDVSESSNSVSIAVFLGVDPAATRGRASPLVCELVGFPRATVVHLASRLGPRRVFDGATGEAHAVFQRLP